MEEKQGVMVTISLSKYEDMIAKVERLEKLEAERDKELDEFEKYHNQIKFWTSEVNRLEKELKQYKEPEDFSQLPKERNKTEKPKLKIYEEIIMSAFGAKDGSVTLKENNNILSKLKQIWKKLSK